MHTTFPSRWFAVALTVVACAGCAEIQQAGVAIQGWLRDYSHGRYRATPQQVRVAHQRASRHDARVSAKRKTQKRDSSKRYVAVRTLDPSPSQVAEIKKRAKSGGYGRTASYGGQRTQAGSAKVEGQYHCVMIWDTWAKQVVGNDCYAVTKLPRIGEVARFDTYSAEYIGTGGG